MGIGRASARAFADAGASAVVVADIDEEGASETIASVEKAGATAAFVPTDVSEHRAVAHLLDETVRQFGRLDVLHNNAGIVGGEPAWPGTSVERIEQMVRVNALGVMFGTRLAVDRMAAAGGGAIVNTASMTGLWPTPPDAVYCATKAAIIMFTRACAELAQSHNIRVNAVLPGATDTSMIAKSGDGTRPAAWLADLLTPDTLLAPGDVAAAVVALAAGDQAGEAVEVLEPAAPRSR
jgi:NAD(P)-dependent dehydrogenase (short-subunit alcohol dehydrogenase family)